MIDNATRDEKALEDRVTGLINERLDILVDDPATDLVATGLLDSLAFVTLLHAIEQEFEITISTGKAG